MKKILSMLVLIALVLSNICCIATQVPDFEGRPEPDMSAGVSEGIRLTLPDGSLVLDFDPLPGFSFAENGVVQASFYAYGPDGILLYEMYMTFPETVSAGSVFTPEAAIQAGRTDCCVVLLISTYTTEDYYMAAQYGQGPYPEGTHYAIRFDNVTDTASGRLFSGTLTATLSGEDINGAVIPEKLVFTEAPFSFTLPTGNSSELPFPETSPLPGTTPIPGFVPAPTPTVRPDLYRI